MTKAKRAARVRAMQAGRRNYKRWRAVLREARAPGSPQFLEAAIVGRPDLVVTWTDARSIGVDEFLTGRRLNAAARALEGDPLLSISPDRVRWP